MVSKETVYDLMHEILSLKITWWRHQMETFSALLAICAGNSPVPGEFPHKGQWRGALMFSLINAWINDWVNNREAGDLRHHHAHYDIIVMTQKIAYKMCTQFCGVVFYGNYITSCFWIQMMRVKSTINPQPNTDNVHNSWDVLYPKWQTLCPGLIFCVRNK